MNRDKKDFNPDKAGTSEAGAVELEENKLDEASGGLSYTQDPLALKAGPHVLPVAKKVI